MASIGPITVKMNVKVALWSIIKMRLAGIIMGKPKVTIQDLIDKDKEK